MYADLWKAITASEFPEVEDLLDQLVLSCIYEDSVEELRDWPLRYSAHYQNILYNVDQPAYRREGASRFLAGEKRVRKAYEGFKPVRSEA